ncbi:MAG TPA: imidazoleglycerol-phosphate dehydratase HisB [Candidatus Goldiibacteriota bacterium]|nr:imidazoleglycerol-phosphate dehydratase HisB [Candidatus Goldiibacteriota bacterium]
MSKKARKSAIKRKTAETEISLAVNLDGKGRYSIRTNEPFLNHMLEQLSRHSGIDMKIEAVGDTQIDAHHLTEDLGIVLGKAIAGALGNKKGIKRFGVLDEALCRVVLDLSGRAYLDYNVKLKTKKIGSFDTELVEEFMNGFVRGGNFTLHIDQLKGKNTHHVIEAVFKGLALALKEAVKIEGKSLPSTKGRL